MNSIKKIKKLNSREIFLSSKSNRFIFLRVGGSVGSTVVVVGGGGTVVGGGVVGGGVVGCTKEEYKNDYEKFWFKV